MLNTATPLPHPDPAQLEHLDAFARLDPETRGALASQLSLLHAAPGSELLALGETDKSMLYLLDGELLLEAVDGARQRIAARDDSARRPIARLRPSRYRVTAAGPVSYLMVPPELLGETGADAGGGADGLAGYEVSEIEDGSQPLIEDQLARRLYEDLNNGHLLLPSLPDVAIRVGQAIDHELADAQRVARVIENDPAITAKLIRVANSARYGGRAPAATLVDAITRIGLRATHSLVITFALRELFRCQTPLLYETMRDLWEEARQVAVIAQVLARHCGSIDPDTALLAGLVHNIGAVAVIGYARDFPELAQDRAVLEGVVQRIRGPLGGMILTDWGFPRALVEAVGADDIMRDHAGACDIGDVINVARAQARLDKTGPVPPACAKLGLEPGMIGPLLEQAREALQEMLALLSQ